MHRESQCAQGHMSLLGGSPPKPGLAPSKAEEGGGRRNTPRSSARSAHMRRTPRLGCQGLCRTHCRGPRDPEPVPRPGSGQGRGTARNSQSYCDPKAHGHLETATTYKTTRGHGTTQRRGGGESVQAQLLRATSRESLEEQGPGAVPGTHQRPGERESCARGWPSSWRRAQCFM